MRKLHLFVRIDNHAGLSRIFGSDYLLTLFMFTVSFSHAIFLCLVLTFLLERCMRGKQLGVPYFCPSSKTWTMPWPSGATVLRPPPTAATSLWLQPPPGTWPWCSCMGMASPVTCCSQQIGTAQLWTRTQRQGQSVLRLRQLKKAPSAEQYSSTTSSCILYIIFLFV